MKRITPQLLTPCLHLVTTFLEIIKSFLDNGLKNDFEIHVEPAGIELVIVKTLDRACSFLKFSILSISSILATDLKLESKQRSMTLSTEVLHTDSIEVLSIKSLK